MFIPKIKPQDTKQRNTFRICKKQSISWLPFRWWLGAKHQKYNIKAIKPYALNVLWLEYRADCEYYNLDHESASNFGLWG